jgi:hypothetical protein
MVFRQMPERKEEPVGRRILAVACLGLLAGGCVRLIAHNEHRAAAKAEEFAACAFVARDLDKAYALLAESTRKQVSAAQFTSGAATMHPKAYPLAVRAAEFEPVPGQEMMYVFLVGRHGAESFHYRFVMEGTGPSGYQVAGFWRGTGEYPASRLRKPIGPGRQ